MKSIEKNVYMVVQDEDGPYLMINEEPDLNDIVLFVSEELFEAESYLCRACQY